MESPEGRRGPAAARAEACRRCQVPSHRDVQRLEVNCPLELHAYVVCYRRGQVDQGQVRLIMHVKTHLLGLRLLSESICWVIFYELSFC